MKSLEEIWTVLNAGQHITNGELEIWYKDGSIHSDPEVENPLIFQNKDDVEDWEVVTVEDEDAPLYCRWYSVRSDGSLRIDDNVWWLLEKEPLAHYFRMGEAYTKEAIVGG